MKHYLLFCFLLVPSVILSQTHLDGNVLTLSNGARISIGEQLHIGQPSKGSKFNFIYNELSLRASSEEDLPYGVATSFANKQVIVKRFLVRKGARGSKFYVITGSSFINNAIDIENAIRSGEVVLESSSNDANRDASAQHLPVNGGGYGNSTEQRLPETNYGANGTNGAILAGTASTGVISHAMKRPWDPAEPAGVAPKVIQNPIPKKDTLAKVDSNKHFEQAFKSVDSASRVIEKNSTSKPEKQDTVLTATKLTTEPIKQPLTKNDNSVLIKAPPTTVEAVSESAALPKSETSEVLPEPAHSVSSLMTLPSPESLKPKVVETVPVAVSPKESNSGYDKYTKLKQLKELLDSGVLSKTEFDDEKKKILEGN